MKLFGRSQFMILSGDRLGNRGKKYQEWSFSKVNSYIGCKKVQKGAGLQTCREESEILHPLG